MYKMYVTNLTTLKNSILYSIDEVQVYINIQNEIIYLVFIFQNIKGDNHSQFHVFYYNSLLKPSKLENI
jgi:hypothetical protein